MNRPTNTRKDPRENPRMNPLTIIVCIKPVPDPSRWSKLGLDPETMLLNRSGIPAVINPPDRNALTTALSLKARHGGTIHVLTMAPPEGEDQLREALAMGCDRAVLLTDRAFAGADTMATARCLAAAARKIGEFDLIVCGGHSLDGSTAQVGPQLAELLGLPDLTYTTSVEVAGSSLKATCKMEDGPATFEAELPALVTVAPECNRPKLPSMPGISRAAAARIETWTAEDLGLAPESVGLAGSPTRMLNVSSAPVGRKGEILQGTPDELAAKLLQKLQPSPINRT
jgi:electron transfer flavoprotein beta subunit